MVFIGSMSSFMKFGGQTCKNVHDVWKNCLETTLCVYACFVKFYVFALDKIDMVGPKLVYKHIWDGNFRVRLHVGSTRGPRGGPKSRLKVARQLACRDKWWPKRHLSSGDGSSMGSIDGSTWPTGWGVERETNETSSMGRGWDHIPSVLHVDRVVCFLPIFY